MAKVKGKQDAKEHEPGSDPKVLYKNYLQACDAIGIQHFPPLKHILTNEENPSIGTQIVVVGEGNSVLGSGGCRALVNAMIGKPNATTTTIAPFTATKEIRIIHCNLQDGGAAAIAKLLFATAGRKCINTAGDGVTLPPEWKLDYLELMDNDISRDGAMVLGRSLSVGMNTTLSTLVLDFNVTLRSDGIEALCKGISTNSTLKKLSLKHCNIDEKGGEPIANMLKFKKLGLISLDLTCNQLCGIGLADICIGLMQNTSLKTFRLADNQVGQSEPDVKALELFSNVLVKHPALIAVDLLHNKIGTKGGALLVPCVRENKQITTFKVDSNMDDEIYKELFRVCQPKKASKKKSKKKK